MPVPLRCALIGSGAPLIACAEQLLARDHSIIAIISSCPEVRAWSRQRALPLTDSSADLVAVLAREPFDYLFSVVHHGILSKEVLALPRLGAINYHDAPLPAYAGFHATAWAILDGRTQHGVTWHEMTEEVDAGRILARAPVAIADDDTAFTLSVKCSEAALAAFRTLLPRLEAQRAGEPLEGEPQVGPRSFHARSERPDAVLDLRGTARELLACVRALDFGPDDSPLGKPKLWLGSGFAVVTEASLEASVDAPPGRVLSIDTRGLCVAVRDGALRLAGFFTPDGEALEPEALCVRFGLEVGRQLEAWPERERCRALDAGLSKHERFWIARLAAPTPPRLAELRPHTGAGKTRVLTRPLPAGLEGKAPDECAALLLAALAAYVARVGEAGAFQLGLEVDAEQLPRSLRPLYASVVPLGFEPELERGFGALLEQARAELAQQARHVSYARDVVLRQRTLRGAERSARALPIALRVQREAEPALCEGSQLTLALRDGEQGYAWIYDEAVLPEPALTRLAARFELLLEAALDDLELPLGRLPILPAAERALLVDTWQDTAVAYDPEQGVAQLFEAQVAHTPERTALVFRERSLSYRELDLRANRVAHALIARGAGPDTLVGVCVERSLELVIALLGIAKAGAAYVPLDPTYPRERVALMLEDAGVKLVLSQTDLMPTLPVPAAQLLCVEALIEDERLSEQRPALRCHPDQLAYVIFTSGSTGRPKGVMVMQRNLANFLRGMDAVLGHEPGGADPGVWLAVTSISFDISVLELFWSLTRGFEVVLQESLDRAAQDGTRARVVSSAYGGSTQASAQPMGFGLFYFAAETGTGDERGAYRLLLEGARFADAHGFDAVWTPERHFHAFGGLYPNPAVTTAALATITQRVQLRAGSVVIPLHHPLRVAEDWAVIDQLSGGRIGLSFASGWHVNDFALRPENYARRQQVMLESIDTVQRLWRGEKIRVPNGAGEEIEVGVLPRPLQAAPPVWIASAGNVETFQLAGRHGFNVLTNMLGQSLSDLRVKLAAYREARRAHGHAGEGVVSVMLHTFVCDDDARARELARRPFQRYLESSFDLVKVAPWMFPAFRRPSRAPSDDASVDTSGFTPEDMQALLDHAFDRYFDSAGLFGTPERALRMVEQLKAIGVNEVACLIDFGIDTDTVLDSLVQLERLRDLSNAAPASAPSPSPSSEEFSLGANLARRRVTHLQCTPSLARMLLGDPEARAALSGVQKLLLGGEALAPDLLEALAPWFKGDIVNMYGPTETTVWSTSAPVKAGGDVTIGRPIANTVLRVVDARRELVPIGVPGELCIGGAGVARGYLGRPELDAERFVPDPCDPSARVYRTGDLVRYRDDGALEFLGRLDQQVKLNGYRIELGEIESALARHPKLRQSVVAAHGEDGPARLVAYVVPAGSDAGAAADSERVAPWQHVWDETYRLAGSERQVDDPRFNIAGWRDSATQALIPADEMRAWRDAVVARILEQTPGRVLELGCGTGLLLYALLPRVDSYTGLDLSPFALESIRRELTPEEAAKVTLLPRAAHALEGFAAGSFDTVIINSVAQYFPDADYLTQVIARASELLADGGRIVVGDVRDLAQLDAFHTFVELALAPASLSARDLALRIERRAQNETELLVSESFFHDLAAKLPRIAGLQVRLKPGLARNELVRFRCDVVLHVGRAPGTYALPVAAMPGLASLAEVSQRLAAEPTLLWLSDVPNARVAGLHRLRAALADAPGTNVGALRESYLNAEVGVDPGQLEALHPDYEVDVRPARSGDPACFDVVLSHRTRGPRGLPALPPLSGQALANRPARVREGDGLADELRAHLRQSLPEFMIPSDFIVLRALPLTPNGKLDRKALPRPERGARREAAPFVAPQSTLEQQIAETWQTLLQLPRVGRGENIFELGANSLLTVQAANRLSAALGRKVPLVSMFRFPSVEALAEHLAGSDAPAPAAAARQDEREERRKDAVARRRQLRAERAERSAE